jgi:DNA-binding NtrC family response regulator
MKRILVVDDEAVIREALTRLLEREGYSVQAAGSLAEAATACTESSPDLALCDLRLPDGEGTALIERCAPAPVLILTSYASVRSAVEAMKQGAADYVAKPFDHEELVLVIARLLKQRDLERENARLRSDLEQAYPVNGLVGRSAAMQQVFQTIDKAAPTNATVLIRGESGTGKELVARAIHMRSPRSERPFVAVNCASIPEGLLEAELFGHEKGAFTGAVRERQGLVEAADGGTLFLDEIGELTPAAQSRLLRVLQSGEIRRVGAASNRRIDVRLLAATHRDLEQMVASGQFREDLYYRLRVLELNLPPLRERGEDLGQLAHFMLERSAQRVHRTPPTLTAAAMEAIECHSWPGNVRELENAIERAVILAEGEIRPEHLALGDPAPGSDTAERQQALSLDEYFRRFVEEHQHALTETELARRLGISRKTLWERRQRMGIPRPRT